MHGQTDAERGPRYEGPGTGDATRPGAGSLRERRSRRLLVHGCRVEQHGDVPRRLTCASRRWCAVQNCTTRTALRPWPPSHQMSWLLLDAK
jgi:hypothetical protein